MFLKDGYLNDENSRLGSWLFERRTYIIDQEYRKLGSDGEELIRFASYLKNVATSRAGKAIIELPKDVFDIRVQQIIEILRG